MPALLEVHTLTNRVRILLFNFLYQKLLFLVSRLFFLTNWQIFFQLFYYFTFSLFQGNLVSFCLIIS